MADDSEDINININSNIPEQADASINSLKGLKQAYKDAMNDMAAGTAGAAERAADLKDQLEDLQDQTKSLKGTGIEKLTSSMSLLKDGFANADPGKLGIAMKGLGAAMKAIPIFLIIEGIRWLIENFEKLSKSGGILGKIFSTIGDIVGAVIQAFKDLTDWLGITNFAIEENAEKTIEASKKASEAVQQRYDDEIKIAKAAGKDTTEQELKKQQAVIASIRVQVAALKTLYDATGSLSEEQQKQLEEFVTNIHKAEVEMQVLKAQTQKKLEDEQKKANEKAVAEATTNAKKLRDLETENIKITYDRKKQEIINFYADEQEKFKGQTAILEQLTIAKNNKLNDLYRAQKAEEEKIRASAAKVELKQMEEVDVAFSASLAKKTELSIKQAEEQKAIQELSNEEILAGINSLADSISSLLNSISEYNQMKADEAIKVNEEALDQQLSALDAARDKELAKEGLTNEQKVAIENKYKLQKYDLELKEYNANTAIKKKAFEQDKKMKIAQAIISTITGVVSAVTGMISAIPGPVGIVLGALAGVAVAAAGAVQIAKIKNTQFDAGSPPSPPNLAVPSSSGAGLSGSSSGASQPSFDLFGRNSTGNGTANNSSNQGSAQAQPVVKAYVVSQEITDQQTANNYSTTMGSL